MKTHIAKLVSAGSAARVAILFLVAAAPLTARGQSSLARQTPADTGLFVEMTKADDLLTELSEPQIWLALAELAGQPATERDTDEWQRRIRETVGMEPKEAIRALFSRAVAFVGEGPGRAQDAVVICKPALPATELISRWNAQRQPSEGPALIYQLQGEMGLAVRDGLLLFGDIGLKDGTFGRLAQFAPGRNKSLAEDPTYRGLLQRVPGDPDGVLFARLNPPAAQDETAKPASQPASAPGGLAQLGPLRGSSNILLALHRERDRLHFSAVGDGKSADAAPIAGLEELVASLPENTLIAWASGVDYDGLVEAGNALPDRNAFKVILRLLEKSGTLDRLVDALEPATCAALGYVSPEGRRVSAPPIPAAALVVRASNPAGLDDEMTAAVQSTFSIYALLALSRGLPALPPIATSVYEDLPIHELNLGALLGEHPEQTPLAQIHFSWAVDGDALILASNTQWLKKIVDARQGRIGPLKSVLNLTKRPPGKSLQNVMVLQTGPVADLAAEWLRYFEQVYPQILKEAWWREYQPGGRTPSLGINVTQMAQEKRLRVDRVLSGGPAAGILRPGDLVVGMSGRNFRTEKPVEEAQEALAARPDVRWIELQVEHDGKQINRRVPLPFVDPIQLLRRVAAIGHVAQRVVYHDEATPEGPRGYLTVELRRNSPPLYSFQLTPIAQPVGSQPNANGK